MDHVYTATCTIYRLNVVGKVTGNYHSLGPGSLQILFLLHWSCRSNDLDISFSGVNKTERRLAYAYRAE